MYTKEIEAIIGEYLNNESAEYAILIDGEWGSGKTYFLKHSLMGVVENVDARKAEKRKCAYVSLYGLKSIEEVARGIWIQCIGSNSEKKETTSKVLKTAGNFLTAALGVCNFDLDKAADFVATLEIKDWIICFDDLERSSIPINDILGYMNQLVEHNKCKMIILANEKEIGKQIEEDSKEQQLYKTVREKVIGLTIRFEPQMKEVYDSIIAEQFKADTGLKKYLVECKEEILMCFLSRGCTNIRTLKIALGSIGRVYAAMEKNDYTTDSTFKDIMDSFVQYIIYLTVYLRNGEDVKELGLTTSDGYVKFDKKNYKRIRGYKFLEEYCTTMSFSEKEFIEVVATLRKEYKEQEEIEKKQREKIAVAYKELRAWYLLEDEDVAKKILLLWEELKQNKYYYEMYQEIIGLLIILENAGFAVGDYDELIRIMNRNTEQAEELPKVNRRSYSFKDEPELQEKYDTYVDMLAAMVDNRKQELQAGMLNVYLDDSKWFDSLKEYCLEHQNDFIMRNGFIDLLDMEILLEKIKAASVGEIRCLDDILATVYIAENIRSFFMRDKEKLQELLDKIREMEFSGINKPLAKEELERCIEKILKKLQ